MPAGQVITTVESVAPVDEFLGDADRGIGLEGPFRIAAADASAQLAMLLPMGVESRAENTPPVTPADGDRYIVAASATGAWGGHEGEIARYRGEAWDFSAPIDGLLVHVADEDAQYYYRLSTAEWVKIATGLVPWTPLVAQAPSTAFTATAPASAVTNGGASYVCNMSPTSDATFAGDTSKSTQSAIVGDSPGGSSGQIQYNNGGAFGGVTGFSFDGTKLTLTKRIEQGMTSYVDGIAIGVGAGANLSGIGTVAIGKDALAVATSSSNTVAIGRNALKALTAGSGSVAIGTDALLADTTGTGNVAIGRFTLKAANPSQNNIAIGDQALTALTTGSSNVAIGVLALKSATTAGGCVVIGTTAGQSVTTGGGNVFLGSGSGYSETTGDNNVAIGPTTCRNSVGNNSSVFIGYQAGYNATGVFASIGIGFGALKAEASAYPAYLSQNIAIGYTAMYKTTTGSLNVALGVHALQENTTGSNNTAIGTLANGQNTTGNNNTSVGNYALGATTSGGNNTAVGFSSLGSVTTGANNTAIGHGTGAGISTGSNNTIIGAGVSGLSASLADAIVIAIGNGTIKAEFNKTDAGGWLFNGPVRPKAYTVATLPAGVEGQIAYASNGRKVGQGAGSGTGVPVYFADGAWRVFSTDAAVAA